ncbi:peptidylprolyl isomerase [Georgenia sp. H159]|uniref:peptidylprolyl isomerase n=1 Tax=Georgenia sp. H159 TaxID=3076115 RepID=UPI002D788E85|nr:peptidylprolyl isomerase [Georgenia sp. H159]
MTRSTKQERAYQKRRHDKWEQRSRERAARRRRITLVSAVVVGLALVVGAIVLIVANQPDEQAPDPATTGESVDPATPDVAAPLPTTDPELYDAPPDPAEAEGRTWNLTLQTSAGDIGLEIDGENAPQAAANFLRLARDGFYDGTACHRLLPEALLQCGDPTATGTGGPGYTFGPIENAPEDGVYPAGTLAMARQGENGESMGSQFFLVFADVPLPSDSAGGYSIFGRVTEGLEILQQVGSAGTVEGSEQPALPVTIEGVTSE